MSWMKFLGYLFAGYLAFQGVVLIAVGPEMGSVGGGVIGGGVGTLAFGVLVGFLVYKYL